MKKTKNHVTWYINPASIIGTVASSIATFMFLDIYCKQETGEGIMDGVKAKIFKSNR